MTYSDLIGRAREHLADYRELHPNRPLPPELFTLERMTAALESQVRLNERSCEVIHAAINDLTGALALKGR